MEIGRIIGGKYRLTREIGEGAMGSVWAAAHELLGRSVAIKFMRPALEDAETAAARFVAEAKAAAQLKHRFIVDVFDFGITEDGQYYMVQELLDGESLAQVQEQGPAWPVQDVVRFAAQCLSGLSAVHASGVVHRDLKPENIFVMRDADGRFPKLLDFGISKAASALLERSPGRELKRPSLRAARHGRHLTALGAAPGTPAYMSPEQLRNQGDLDGRADLYSLGVVLYEWLSGSVPYPASSDFPALCRAILARTMTPLEQLRPDLDPALCKAIARALAPEAKDRFANASEMRDALLASLPSSSALLSVIQTAGKSAARFGQETQVLLESAGDPFADPDEARFLPRFTGVHLALAGLVLVALGGGIWLSRGAEQTPAAAHVEPTASTPPSSSPMLPQAPKGRAQEQAAAAPVHDTPAPTQGVPDLPIGADIPEEDLPVILPGELRTSGAESERAPVAAHEKRREHVRLPVPASEPTKALQTAVPSLQNTDSASSRGPDRPIRQKVVRQLDF